MQAKTLVTGWSEAVRHGAVESVARITRKPMRDEIEAGASEPAAPAPSMIAAETEISGAIKTSHDLHIHGAIIGDVEAVTVVVCDGGLVRGDIVARTAVVHGTVKGEIRADDVRLCPGAKVDGGVVSRTLGIDTAAVFEGAIKRVEASVESAND